MNDLAFTHGLAPAVIFFVLVLAAIVGIDTYRNRRNTHDD